MTTSSQFNPLVLVDPIVDLIAISIIVASIYFISRQKRSQYPDAKNLLLLVYVFFEGVMVVELLRSFITTNSFMMIYAIGGTSFVLLDVALLTLLGVLVYLKPPEKSFSERFVAVFRKFPHGIILGGFIAFISYSELVLALTPNAIQIKQLPDIFDIFSPVKTAQLSSAWLLEALIILVIFISYTTTLFIAAGRKTTNMTARKALFIVPLSWIVIGMELITFNGVLVKAGYDVIGYGYVIAATAFALTAYSFRDTSTVASFFSPIDHQVLPVSHSFSSMLGDSERSSASGAFLLEAEPSVAFEHVVRDFAVEQISNRVPVFLFSAKGYPVYNALAAVEDMRFYTFTSNLSFPKPTDNPLQILVPSNDEAILLDVLQKTITAYQGSKIAIVYNSLSDAILSWGMETSYKFLKSAIEMLTTPNVATLFLMAAGTHDERTTNLVRSLFSKLLYFGEGGFKVVKLA